MKPYLITAVAVAAAISLSTPAQSQAVVVTPSLDTKIIVALISVGGIIVSALLSAAIAYFLARFTAQNTVRSEHAKRQAELGLKISELVSTKEEDARRSAMRRFAVGIIKVMAPTQHPECGNVYFVPMNSRITVGRSDDNDIVLKDDENILSRWHCGFIADQHKVWIDDYKSTNGTKVNGAYIKKPFRLASEDDITIGPYRMHFRSIRENTILTQ
jgi:hypothetical protein